jgi:hypothetical protein
MLNVIKSAAKELKQAMEKVTYQDPWKTQEGGNHYKDFKIQPADFIHANSIPYLEGNVIKYICRHRTKGGLQDLRKAQHYIELLIDLEYRNQLAGE